MPRQVRSSSPADEFTVTLRHSATVHTNQNEPNKPFCTQDGVLCPTCVSRRSASRLSGTYAPTFPLLGARLQGLLFVRLHESHMLVIARGFIRQLLCMRILLCSGLNVSLPPHDSTACQALGMTVRAEAQTGFLGEQGQKRIGVIPASPAEFAAFEAGMAPHVVPLGAAAQTQRITSGPRPCWQKGS